METDDLWMLSVYSFVVGVRFKSFCDNIFIAFSLSKEFIDDFEFYIFPLKQKKKTEKNFE